MEETLIEIKQIEYTEQDRDREKEKNSVKLWEKNQKNSRLT